MKDFMRIQINKYNLVMIHANNASEKACINVKSVKKMQYYKVTQILVYQRKATFNQLINLIKFLSVMIIVNFVKIKLTNVHHAET